MVAITFGEGADGGHHIEGEGPSVGGRGAADLHGLLGRDRAVGLELGDIDQELHGGTPEICQQRSKDRVYLDFGSQRGGLHGITRRVCLTDLL
jgi:hypothetical protein